MGAQSHIEWCDATWNLARGCKKVDTDCLNCYMYRDSRNFYNPREVVRTKTVFNLPLKLADGMTDLGRPRRIFTSSLTDFFLPDIDAYRAEAWDIIRACPHHIFQILTKRPERIPFCLPPDWSAEKYSHVWLGTSVGSMGGKQRILDLAGRMRRDCRTIFLSAEPLTTVLDIWPYLGEGLLDWVIVGGESGNLSGKYKARKCDLFWLNRIVEQCHAYDVPVFVKQLGTVLAHEMGLTDRHGRDINEFPDNLKIRQFPKTLVYG